MRRREGEEARRREGEEARRREGRGGERGGGEGDRRREIDCKAKEFLLLTFWGSRKPNEVVMVMVHASPLGQDLRSMAALVCNSHLYKKQMLHHSSSFFFPKSPHELPEHPELVTKSNSFRERLPKCFFESLVVNQFGAHVRLVLGHRHGSN